MTLRLRPLILLSTALFLAGGAAGYRYSAVQEGAGRTAVTVSGDSGNETGALNRNPEPVLRSGRPAGAAAGGAWDRIQRLQSATAEEMPGLWAGLTPRPENLWLYKAPTPEQRLLMERWAELDPRGALEFVKNLGKDGTPLFENVFRSWGATDAAAALEALRGIDGLEARGLCVKGLLASAADDPAKAVSLLQRLTWMDVSGLKEEAFLQILPEDLLRRMYAADGEGLRALVSRLPPWFAGRLEAVEWRRALAAGPAEAERVFSSLKWDEHTGGRMAPALTELARTHPQAAADWLERMAEKAGGGKDWLKAGDNTTGALIRTLMERLGPEDPERMRALLLHRMAPVTQVYAAGMIRDLLESHPAQALRLAPALPAMDSLINLTGEPPPVSNPSETLALVKEAPASWHRDRLMEEALFKLRGADPAAAAAWAESLPEGALRDAANVALNLADAPPEIRSLEYAAQGAAAEGLEEAGLERVKRAASAAAMVQAQKAAERVSVWPAGEMRDLAVQAVAGSWALQNTGEALTWAQALPDAASQAAALSGVLETWTVTEPRAASEWLAAQTPGPVRDAAAGAFVSSLVKLDPEAAAHWAASIGEEGVREKKLKEVFSAWHKAGAGEAAGAVQTLPGLTETERRTLGEQLSRPSAP